jgi:protein SCO1
MNQLLRDKPWALGIIVVALGALAIGVWSLLAAEEHEWNGMAYEPARDLQGFTLTDTRGEPLTLRDLEGKATLLYFGYTFCPDFCPATLTDFQRVKEELGDEAGDVAFVMVTVDPARDTPARMQEYLDFFDPGFIGLTGSDEEIEHVKREFGITSIGQGATPAEGGFYSVDHSTQAYLLDRDTNLVIEYPWGMPAEEILADVRFVLDS